MLYLLLIYFLTKHFLYIINKDLIFRILSEKKKKIFSFIYIEAIVDIITIQNVYKNKHF